MHCGNCHNDFNTYVVFPTRAGSDRMCLPCARKLGLWCDAHEVQHIGFADGTHACLACINAQLLLHVERAGPVLEDLRRAFPTEQLQPLEEWLELVTTITGETQQTCFTRALVTLALRTDRTVEACVAEIREASSIIQLLPFAFV